MYYFDYGGGNIELEMISGNNGKEEEIVLGVVIETISKIVIETIYKIVMETIYKVVIERIYKIVIERDRRQRAVERRSCRGHTRLGSRGDSVIVRVTFSNGWTDILPAVYLAICCLSLRLAVLTQ